MQGNVHSLDYGFVTPSTFACGEENNVSERTNVSADVPLKSRWWSSCEKIFSTRPL